MRTLRLALPIFMLAHASLAPAQDLTGAYGGIPDAVIESIGKKDVKGMFRAMSKSDKKFVEPDPMMDSFAKQLEEQFKDTGDLLDADLYLEERYGSRVSILTYVLNYAQKPMGLKMQMYNGKNGWRAITVNFSPNIEKFASGLRGAPKEN